MKKTYLVLPSLAFIFLIGMSASYVNADEDYTVYTIDYPIHVGVILSENCKTMIKNNWTTTCPTYEEINNVFPDTSNFMSGKLKIIDGIFQRDTPLIEKHFNYYYNYDDNVFWVDPPLNTQNRIKVIEIKSNKLEYKIFDTITNQSSRKITDDMTQYLGQFRYTDSLCKNSYIDSSHWKFLINDTKNFMLNNCNTNSTSLNIIKETILPKTEIIISDSPNWQYQQWLKESQKLCKTLCFE